MREQTNLLARIDDEFCSGFSNSKQTCK